MELKIAARHMDLTPALVDFIQKKLVRTQKYFELIAVHVILKCEKRRQTAKVIITGSGATFRAVETAGDLYSAIDLVVDKVGMQMKKHKEKCKFHHRKKKYARDEVGEEMPVKAIKKKEAIVPNFMSVNEAVKVLSSSNRKSFVFYDQATNQLKILEKRNGGFELMDILYD